MCGGGSDSGGGGGGGGGSSYSSSSDASFDREFEAAIAQSEANRNSGGGGVSYGTSGYYDSSSGRITSQDIGSSSSPAQSAPRQKIDTIKVGAGGVDPAVAKAAGYTVKADGTATKAVSFNAGPTTVTETKTVQVGYGAGQLDPALAKAAGFTINNGVGTKEVTTLVGQDPTYNYSYAAPVALRDLKDGQATMLGADGKVISSSGVGSVADLAAQGFDMTTWEDAQPWDGWSSSSDVIGTDVRNANRAANPFDRDGDGSMWTYTDFNGNKFNSLTDQYISGANDSTTLGGLTKEQYTNQVLSDAGYTDTFKGVTGSNGNSIMDKNGNPIASGTYAQKQAEANSMFDAQVLYNNAKDYYQKAWAQDHGNKLADGLVISNDLIETAIGKRVNASAAEIAAAQKEFGDLYGRGYVVAGANFDDPLGQYMDANIGTLENSNLLGSNLNYNNFGANFAQGYNQSGKFKDTGGLEMEIDNSRNVGFSTGMQRFGDAAAGFILGSVIPGGSALKVNSMDIYGPNVPGMNAVASELTFNPGGLLGDFIGNYASNYAAGPAAQAVYNATGGNVNAAIAGGVGASALAGSLGNSAGQALATGIGITPMTISSDISGVASQQYKQNLDNAGFGQNLSETIAKQSGRSPGDSNGPSDAATRFGVSSEMIDSSTGNNAQAPVMATQDNLTSNDTVNTAADVATGDLIGDGTTTEFDSEAWKNQQYLMNTSTGVSALNGSTAYDSEPNPMFSMSAPTGVQYLNKGRQRDYGNATYSIANPIQQYKGSRRRGFGDRLVGIVI